MHFHTFLVEAVVVVLVHGPRHAEVGELDGARRVYEAVPEQHNLNLPPSNLLFALSFVLTCRRRRGGRT